MAQSKIAKSAISSASNFDNVNSNNISLFLCGDVMIGRGIDQILPFPCDPQIYEPYVTDARDYVYLAEQLNGKIPYPVSWDYIWGDALLFWKQLKPHAKIINLETAVTTSNDYWPLKGINYRIHPLNINVLKIADINACTLANNHILDWGYAGLKETLQTLHDNNIAVAGAGENNAQAMQPAVIELASFNKRILVFAAGMRSSGIPPDWQATESNSGLFYVPNFSNQVLHTIAENINHYKHPNDLIIFSLHWGGNWGYDIPESFREFAHTLIDNAKIDVLYGHSSHHPRAIEIYNDKAIIYGCGDFINDYEGISGHEIFRADLSLMYFLDFDQTSWQLKQIKLIPLQIKNFSLHSAGAKDRELMLKTLNQSVPFAAPFRLQDQSLIYSLD